MKLEPSMIHDWVFWIATGLAGVISSVVWWVGRIVFTNNKRLDLLEQENRHARELRESQDGAIQEIRRDQKKLVEHLLKSR
ncbi:MAG: hypothetical protein ABJM26_05410 [Anderseniella sp.]